MYREAWRLQRDFFYDPGYHGLDLAAAEKRYERYVDGLGHRSDLNYLFQEMLGELSVGHLYIGGGDLPKPPKVKGGLLGADWELVGDRYRIARVFDGESWNPELQAPLARPGVDARAGEYLIEVEGRPVRAPASIHSFFEATAGRSVRVRLGTDPSGEGAREVTVVPVETENGLRRRAWVEDNRRTVERLSAGRLGYLHLPNTAGAGYTSFNRYFYPQIDRLGMVVDERYNGGGLVADYIVEALAKSRPTMYVVAREGEMFPTPAGALFGPKVMLVNRHAGSGGDALPWLFRDRGIGPLVGTRTWGGLVGIWDYPPLVDGGGVTAPRGALFPTRGRWEIENQGVTPDHEIEITPADFRAGRDPQLEKAVELALAEVAKGPPPAVVRPEYPNYQLSPWRSEARP
jgi:tricorn protease